MIALTKPDSTQCSGAIPIPPRIPDENPLLEFLNSDRFSVFPGFCDVHVHFREPGFSYKETVVTGTRAAARGGFTAVGTMPNLDPVPDSLKNIALAQEYIDDAGAPINVYPYGSITVAERGERLADLHNMAPYALAFSDDGMGIQSRELMREAMLIAKELGKVIAAHCEDAQLKGNGYINDGDYARAHNHVGIPKESEWRELERDLELAKDTGVAFHACHISCAESVELMRQAKADGIDASCETAPHYLVFDDSMLQEDGRFKMNPPLRSPRDRLALLEAVVDGTVDMIATDHAPHSAAEKSRGLAGSAFGVVGIETSFQAIYTHLVRPEVITMERAMQLYVHNPRKRFGIPLGEDFSVWDLEYVQALDPSEFLSKGRATPFAGTELFGKCLLTVCGGDIAYLDSAAISAEEGQ
ncbi:dihydroorotase [Arcanobacterium pluranimalium]|uniref:dihydroorotase n=1 Tax=Arcanobacterium pluranimalium TaxID=108028 RepID=UPI00195DC576|nr:dihydroorotase [Arcanobacterium pluranimalium]MBM7824250.1 dihydroorotase [Arcanobacterium pluranimalium]